MATMNSEQTTEEGGVELTLENYEEFLSYSIDLDACLRLIKMNSEQITEEGSVELTHGNYEKVLSCALELNARYPKFYVPLSERLKRRYEMAISYPDADGNIIISQVQPDFVTPRGGSNAVPVELNYNTVGVGERTYADILQAIRIICSTMRASRLPIQFIAAAEASPGFTVSDVVGVELNDIARAYIRAQDEAHFRRSTFGAGSGHINATMSAEASPGGGDGLGVEWNDDMLQALLRSTARAIREHGGSQDLLVDEAGGRFVAIHIHPPQQGDHGLVEAAGGTQRIISLIVG